MLSDSDVARYLTKHIGIYPIIEKNFEGACIELTASELAWSLSTKQKVSHGGKIVIPKHDSVLIISNETVYLDNRFAGYCISKVSMQSFGITSAAAPIKPGWIGKLLITLHNVSDNDFFIDVGKEFAIITMHKLRHRSKKLPIQKNARTDLLSRHHIKLEESDYDFLNDEMNGNPEILFEKIRQDSAYVAFKKHFLRRESITNGGIFALILVILCIVFYKYPDTAFIQTVIAAIISPLVLDIIKRSS